MTIFLVFLAGFIGATFTLIGGLRIYQSHQEKNWPTVSCTIISGAVEERWEVVAYDRFSYYVPIASYTYCIDARVFRSSVVASDEKSFWNTSQDDAKHMLNQIITRSVTCVSPHNPTKSVLLTGLSSTRKQHFTALMIVGMALLLFSIYFCWCCFT
jgi:hypothetical protein